MRIRLGLSLLAPLLAMGARAAPPALLNDLFQDHAVLQRDRPIAVWGHAAPGETVTLSLTASTTPAAAAVRALADPSGAWRAELPPLGAGGPYVLTALSSSGAKQVAGDILLGDVFLCSGQSNMELPVLRAGDSWNEIQISANNSIRMLNVEHAISPTPLAAFQKPVAWQTASPETVPDWSAVCFFFARELQVSTQAPIGLVHSSWGGSNIRPWMSAAALRTQGYGPALDILALYAKDQAAAQGQFAHQWEKWWRDKSGDRPGAEPWAAAAGDWRPAPAGLGDWRNWPLGELKDFTGLIWFRTHVTLTAAQAAAPATLRLGPINQVDQTWINGRAVGNTFGYGTERTYSLPAGLLHKGDNVVVVNVLSTYGGGGLLGNDASRALQFADGALVPLDSAWTYRIVPHAVGYPPRAPWESVGGMSTLYNAMIAPLGSFGIRAALWYQGESNTGEADTYQTLLSGLMTDWRRQFGADVPFLVVQLPNFGPPPTAPGESGWAEVREAQRQAVAHDPHAGLAVTIDIGDARNLHPTNKQELAKRLARAARRVIYGEPIAPSGPTAQDATETAAGVSVKFGDIDQALTAYSHDSPIGFELCADAPGSCRFVDARVDGTSVLLLIPSGTSPTRVRYCWADSPVCTLFDRSGLPAAPFEMRLRR
jgi:sialate O-acetylesterase